MGAHAGHQFAVGVLGIDEHTIEHDVVDHLGRGQNLAHLSLPAPLARTQRLERNGHAGLDAHDVGFRHLRPHRHGVEVGELHDRRGGLTGVQRLSLAYPLQHHRAAHRRIDARVVEVGLVAFDGRARFLDLRFHCGELGGRDLQRCVGVLERLFAHRSGFLQLFISLPCLPGLVGHDCLLHALRLERPQPRFIRGQTRFVNLRIDFGDQVARLYVVSDRHADRFQLAGNLRADVHVVLRLELALRGDDFLYIPGNDFADVSAGVCGILRRRPRQEHPQRNRRRQRDDRQQK